MLSNEEARALLGAENERLLALLAEMSGDAERDMAETADFDQHQGDSNDNTEYWRRVGLRKTLEHELDEVAAARQRLDAGLFGRCVSCGDPITDDRLRVLPATVHCRDHSR